MAVRKAYRKRLAHQDVAVDEEFDAVEKLARRIPVVTTNPDGAKRGKKGDVVLLDISGTFHLEVNTDSSTQWRGAALTDIP